MTHACYCVTKHNAPLERMDCPTPEPKGAEVLIRMTAAGVCHSDIHIWEGVYDLGSGNKMTLKDRGVTLPLTMGHEISGEVVKVGPDVKRVKPGMSCVVYPWLGCGECPTCKRGDENLCAIKARPSRSKKSEMGPCRNRNERGSAACPLSLGPVSI